MFCPQTDSSLFFPGQLPRSLLRQERILILLPTPQEEEQVDHGDHSAQPSHIL